MKNPASNSIEIQQAKDKRYRLFVNQSAITAVVDEEMLFGWKKVGYSIRLCEPGTLFELGSSHFCDLPKNIRSVTVSLGPDYRSKGGLIKIDGNAFIAAPCLDPNEEDDGYISRPSIFGDDYSITFVCSLEVDNWTREYSPSEYLKEIFQVFSYENDASTFRYESRFHEDFEYRFEFRIDSELRIAEEVLRWRDYLHKNVDEIDNRLASGSSRRSVVRLFSFPEEVAFTCQQYLLYFVQFLRDLGIDASSELKHEAGRVLFSVTPNNKEGALDTIRTALNVFLRLPASPVTSDMNSEIAVQRLEAQVLRFQSDLKLASAELQAKNATIEANTLTIDIQKRLLNGEILLNSMKNVSPKDKDADREELFGGTVALTVYKKGGAEISLAKIFRWLKEWISKNE